MECTQPWKGRNSLAQGAALGYEETTLSREGAQYFFTEPNPAIMLRPFRAYLNLIHSPQGCAPVLRYYALAGLGELDRMFCEIIINA